MTAHKEEQEISLTLLLVEDDDSLRSSLRMNLEHHGYHVLEAADPVKGLSILAEQPVDIVLCDFMMPRMDGLQFIAKCKERLPDIAIILTTAFGDTEIALKGLRAGAYDYLAKPFAISDLLLVLRKLEEREQLRAHKALRQESLAYSYSFSQIIAQSAGMQDIFETVKRLAKFSTTVLISGESGTGKELLARALHHNSPRRDKPFVAINCGAIPEHLIESELFGHKAGAFTDATRDKKGLFEEAHGGTILLDEVGELPLQLQVKLLRVLQESRIRRVGDEQLIPIDVRIIAATLRDLESDMLEGRFRDDLFYRLNVVALRLPPLRERREDIPLLVQSFIKKLNRRLGLSVKGIEPTALQALLDAPWKGNIRELENCLERAMVMSESQNLKLSDFALAGGGTSADGEASLKLMTALGGELSIKKATRNLEVVLIQRALDRTKGNRTHAAKILEISHRALLYKLKEYGMVAGAVEATDSSGLDEPEVPEDDS
jgi:two-component system response regulator AtoC